MYHMSDHFRSTLALRKDHRNLPAFGVGSVSISDRCQHRSGAEPVDQAALMRSVTTAAGEKVRYLATGSGHVV